MSVYDLALIAIAIIGSIVIPLVIAYRPEHIPFSLRRHDSPMKEPFESNTAIEVFHPDKTIEKCRVIFKGHELISDEKKLTHLTILAQGAALFRIPLNLEDENAKVVVKNGRHTLRKEKFKDLERQPAPRKPTRYSGIVF